MRLRGEAQFGADMHVRDPCPQKFDEINPSKAAHWSSLHLRGMAHRDTPAALIAQFALLPPANLPSL